MDHAFRLGSVIDKHRVACDSHNRATNTRRRRCLTPASTSAGFACALAGYFVAAFKFLENVGERRILCFFALFLRTV
jgi:hypothetical protein